MTADALKEYFDALARLKNNRPTIVPKGTKITNDAVSLEAGRKKGSIKKSRGQFLALIDAIDAAAAEQSKSEQGQTAQVEKWKQMAESLREQLDAALGREHSLVIELYETRKRLAELTGENVLPIRRRKN